MREFLLSSLSPADTGVPDAVLWIAAGEFAPHTPKTLGPRVVVVPETQLDIALVPNAPMILLTDPPVVLGELPAEVAEGAVEFVRQNRELLLQYWRGELTTRETIDALVHVAESL